MALIVGYYPDNEHINDKINDLIQHISHLSQIKRSLFNLMIKYQRIGGI